MKIIGHRGAAGTELENTLASLQQALDYGVYAIEFDVRKTKDNHIVLSHDEVLNRISDTSERVSKLTLEQLQKIPLLSGSNIPTLAEALELIGDTIVFIDIQQSGVVDSLLKTLHQFPHANVRVVSSKHREIATLRKKAPNLKLYASTFTKPFDIIRTAKKLHLHGVSINYWLLNPMTYILAKRANLDICVFTVNHRFQARFLSVLYPDISICTDYPERFMKRNFKDWIRP